MKECEKCLDPVYGLGLCKRHYDIEYPPEPKTSTRRRGPAKGTAPVVGYIGEVSEENTRKVDNLVIRHKQPDFVAYMLGVREEVS